MEVLPVCNMPLPKEQAYLHRKECMLIDLYTYKRACSCVDRPVVTKQTINGKLQYTWTMTFKIQLLVFVVHFQEAIQKLVLYGLM